MRTRGFTPTQGGLPVDSDLRGFPPILVAACEAGLPSLSLLLEGGAEAERGAASFSSVRKAQSLRGNTWPSGSKACDCSFLNTA